MYVINICTVFDTQRYDCLHIYVRILYQIFLCRVVGREDLSPYPTLSHFRLKTKTT